MRKESARLPPAGLPALPENAKETAGPPLCLSLGGRKGKHLRVMLDSTDSGSKILWPILVLKQSSVASICSRQP